MAVPPSQLIFMFHGGVESFVVTFHYSPFHSLTTDRNPQTSGWGSYVSCEFLSSVTSLSVSQDTDALCGGEKILVLALVDTTVIFLCPKKWSLIGPFCTAPCVPWCPVATAPHFENRKSSRISTRCADNHLAKSRPHKIWVFKSPLQTANRVVVSSFSVNYPSLHDKLVPVPGVWLLIEMSFPVDRPRWKGPLSVAGRVMQSLSRNVGVHWEQLEEHPYLHLH